MSPRRIATLIGCTLLIGAATAAPASAQSPSSQASARAVIATYFSALNASMKSGDFAAVVAAYAPDATLTQSNPKGVTKVFHGRTAIGGYYKGLWAKFPGLEFTLRSERTLAPTIVLRYEVAGTPSMTVPGRCSHLFVIQNGLIASEDWVTYFGGK